MGNKNTPTTHNAPLLFLEACAVCFSIALYFIKTSPPSFCNDPYNRENLHCQAERWRHFSLLSRPTQGSPLCLGTSPPLKEWLEAGFLLRVDYHQGHPVPGNLSSTSIRPWFWTPVLVLHAARSSATSLKAKVPFISRENSASPLIPIA